MGRTLLDKIWDAHTVRTEDGGRSVLYIDRQYIHEVTSPWLSQAWNGAASAWHARHKSPPRPTTTSRPVDQHLPIAEAESRRQVEALEANCAKFGIEHFGVGNPRQGIVAHHRPRTGIHTAGHDHRLRRQPHLDARGTGRRGIRRRHLGGRDGLRQPVHHPVQAAEHAHHGRRDTAPGRRSQGCRALHHLAAHRFGRHGLLHRVRRRSDPFALDGRGA